MHENFNRINFLAGPNGSGKTRLLAKLSLDLSRSGGKCVCVSNTPFDRFIASRNIKLLRISKDSIRKISKDNLDSFYSSEHRETFDLKYVLRLLNFMEQVSLTVNVNVGSDDMIDYHYGSIMSADDIYALKHSLYEAGRLGGILLSDTYDSFKHSIHGSLRIIFSLIGDLKRLKIIRDFYLTFYLHDGTPINFKSLSSGEQTLIVTYLFLKIHAVDCDGIFIDEPENSLHPAWQKRFIEIVNAAIGYSNAKFFIATHSPILVSSSLSSYSEQVSIFKVENTIPILVQKGGGGLLQSIEQILDDIYDTITPLNHHLSVKINEILHELFNNRLPKDEALIDLENLKNKSYDDRQIILIESIISKIKNYNLEINNGN